MNSISKFQSEVLDSDSFRAIAALAYRESGLTLVPEKATMIQSRLRHRLRALGLKDFSQYCALIESPDGKEECRQLISALTTNVSSFFREEHHFDRLYEYLEDRLPAARNGAPVRIWSAGCSNGQEAISAAVTILDRLPELAKLDLRILATDIDQNVVRFARLGEYPERWMNGLTDEQRTRYFIPKDTNQDEPTYTIGPAVRNLIRYNELNLLGPWPMKANFDVIFCRNVVIYFDTKTQETLWPRFRQKLGRGGLLLLGHSERIAQPDKHNFVCISPTTYQNISV